MRLKLTLVQERKTEALPLNSNYYMSSAIYRTLERSSPEFSDLMHNYGYSSPDDRRKFKLFTFSNLDVPDRRIEGSRLISFSKTISFTISSPMDDFLQHLVTGLFSDGYFSIDTARFQKGKIISLPEPDFQETMDFSMLSPLVVSVMRGDRLAPIVLQNLLAKYEAVHKKPFRVNGFRMAFSERYIEQKQGKIEKLITIREGREGEAKIKAILCPFTISAPIELMKIGYDCGFGEKNAQGFGMTKA